MSVKAGAEPAGHLDRTRRAGHPLRSLLRTAGGLRRLAIRRLSGIPLLLGLSWLHRRRRDRDRSRIRRRLCARAMGVRRILGRRWLLGRQPHQLGWRRHQRQSRRPRRALAAQSGASGRRAVQQCKPAAEVRWRQSRGRRHRRRRRGCRRGAELPPGKGWGPAQRGPTSPIALDAQAAGRALAIARPCTGQRLPGV